MSYTLTRRQQIAYVDRFNIHKKLVGPRDAAGFTGTDQYNPTPAYANLRCLWENHPDINELHEPLGRTLSESFDVLDYLYVPAGVSIHDTDYVQCRTPGHPQYGQWFAVMGFGALRTKRGNRQGNYFLVRLKRMLPPAGCEGL